MTDARRGVGVWVATCAGVGYFPLAPGTAGSAVGVVVSVALGMLPVAAFWQRVLTILLGVGLLGLGVWAATQAEKHFGRVDPGQVVIDEVVGQIITLLAWPRRSWGWVLAGFLLFRFFDIVKPFPARRVERFPQGWGIMLDDVVAGAYGLATLSLFGLVWK